MSLATIITPHVPYLRRYARALTGSQDSGDAYVQAAIEALVADPDSFPTDINPRAGIFKVFLRIWNSVDVNGHPDGGTGDPKLALMDRRLSTLTPRSRQAFLLVHIEDFKPKDAAAVLDISEDELDELLTTARGEISAQVVSNVLIIEDEPLIAVDIEDVTSSLGHRCIGIARTHKEAIALCADRKPGLVLADIQLADGSSGIDAVNELLADFDVPVIFITAYPERLLTGDKPRARILDDKAVSTGSTQSDYFTGLVF
jgi:DNA-directed RNA polymerase specialized sigma24 family protein/CheY-like chemotaxis protein